jgi:glycosyltransferase involved in cell wall biosynthesis
MSAPSDFVAVVIPTRGRQQVVERAIRSALGQTHRALEVIVVDDGSTPPLVLAPELTSDARLRLLRTDGVGAGAARNLGVAASDAPLVAFLDDDDVWRPEKLEREVATLREAPAGTGAVESGFNLWEGERLVMRYLPDPARDLYVTLLERPALQPSTVLLRRDLFDALGGFDGRIERTEDWQLWVRLSERAEVAILGEVHVDRAFNAELSPAVALRCYREAVRAFAPRIAGLPAADRRRIDATHEFIQGVLASEAGNRGEAGRHFFSAWRRNPRRLRPLVHLVRATAGERAWLAVRRLAHTVRGAWLRARGQDPDVYSW